jgi:hypothetical protein
MRIKGLETRQANRVDFILAAIETVRMSYRSADCHGGSTLPC